jgi:hypothetical protein
MELNKKGSAMKRKSSPEYNNAIGCALLWAAVMRLDRRIAMKILSVAIRERNRTTQLQ